MANNLGSLVVSLGLDAAEFTKGMSKSQYEAYKSTENIKAQFVTLGKFVAGLSVGVSFVNMVNSARTAVDQLKDLEDATGANIEKLSALDTLARSTGGSFDVVGSALVKFNAVLKDSDPGKGAGAVLKSLNLDIERLKSQDPADALREVAVALQGYADNGEKARAVQELFGKSVREVAPFLKDLAEAKRLDATLTAAQVEQVDRFNKQWAKLSTTAEDVGRSFSVGIVSELNTIIEKFKQAEKQGRSFLSALALSPSEMDAKNRAAGAFGAGKMKDAADARAALSALESSAFRPADQDPRMIAARERVRAAEAALAAAGGGRGFVNPDLVKPSAPSLIIPDAPASGGSGGGSKSSVDKSLADYQRLLDDYANAEDANRMKVIRDRIKQEESDLAAALSASRQPAIDELETLQARNVAYQDWLKNLQDQTPTAQLEAQRQAMADLAAEYERGTFGAAGSAEAIAKYGETVNTYLGNVEAGVKQVNATADAAGSIFGSWLDKAITDGAKLSDVIDGLVNDLVRLAIQKSVIEPAAKGFSTGAADLISLFSGFNAYDGGGYTGSGARSGGVDGKGGFPAILHPQETVIDHTKGQSMGGGVSIVNNNDFRGADPGSEMRIKQAIKESEVRTEAIIFKKIKDGGAWSKAVGRA